jgi:hypothetical protein
MSNGRKDDFTKCDIIRFFPNEILEVPIEELRTEDGVRVHLQMFGSSRKKDLVVVSTMFGLLARSLRRKNLSGDIFVQSKEFNNLRRSINAFDLQSKLLAGKNGGNQDLPAIVINTTT